MEYREKSCMKKSGHKCQGILFGLSILLLCLSGCGSRTEGTATEEISLIQEENQPGEIPVDFPFYETEKYTITLVSPVDAAGEYVLMLAEDGQLLQSLSCGRLTEPVTFSYDGIAYGSWRDLEVFSAGSDTGLLFLWKDERFSEEPIRIPRYTEIRMGAMLTVSEDGQTQEKRIYQLNEFRKQAEVVRSWSLDRDSSMLWIEDSLRRQNLFEGKISFNENGELLNQEYYEYLFWRNRSLRWNFSDDPIVYAWLDEERTEGDDACSWRTEEFESRQAFLESCGYTGQAPAYQYCDSFQKQQLELYLDEETQKCFGIVSWSQINCDGENVTTRYGFTVCNIGERPWEEDRAFSLSSVESRGENLEQGYQERVEYTDSGKPDYYLLQGLMEDCGVEVLGKLVEINFIYRDDGTLFTRDYQHDARTYGSTFCGMDSFFDENERVVYETGYITHGSMDFYYFYDDEGETPAYGLSLDYNGGFAMAEMVRFR